MAVMVLVVGCQEFAQLEGFWFKGPPRAWISVGLRSHMHINTCVWCSYRMHSECRLWWGASAHAERVCSSV